MVCLIALRNIFSVAAPGMLVVLSPELATRQQIVVYAFAKRPIAGKGLAPGSLQGAAALPY